MTSGETYFLALVISVFGLFGLHIARLFWQAAQWRAEGRPALSTTREAPPRGVPAA